MSRAEEELFPRFGFAYSMSDKTVGPRKAYGIFMARFQGALLQTLFLSNGVYQPAVFCSTTPAELAAGPVSRQAASVAVKPSLPRAA